MDGGSLDLTQHALCDHCRRLDHDQHYEGDKSRNFLAAFGAWCMPAASPFNSHGLLEKDAVAIFDKLPSCHEHEAILEIPLQILAGSPSPESQVRIVLATGSQRLRPFTGVEVASPQVTLSLVTIIFLLASFTWSQCRGVACPLRASFDRVSQQFRFRVRLHLHCASRHPIFGGPLNPTSLFLQQVTSTSALWITCAGSETLEGAGTAWSFSGRARLHILAEESRTSRLCGWWEDQCQRVTC